MDVAYDHLSESFTDDTTTTTATAAPPPDNKQPAPASTLNSEFQDAYRAFSNSPWGARIGGFFGSVVKQGESVYHEAQKELTAVGQDATRGLTDLRTTILNRTRALSLTTAPVPAEASSSSSSRDADATTPTNATAGGTLSSEEALKESETVLSRLKGEAAKRLKDLQKAEDAADEALLRFGSNLRDFLKDAIKIAPPTAGGSGEAGSSGAVMFESKDAQGKRVIHTSRFDAQLHLIHTNEESFTQDASGPEFGTWYAGFDVAKKTDDIASDLDKYPELRATMERLVPDKVTYPDFWKRYYFLRHGIETAEARRKDLLKAAAAEEEVGWDEDSDEDEEEEDDSDDDSDEESSDDETVPAGKAPATEKRPGSQGSSTTIQPKPNAQLKPSEPRKSNDEKSQADSEASYDVVGARSGVPSQAPNSPKDGRKDGDSDDEDWE